MVKQRTPMGLIAATRDDVTPPLDELVRNCGWPLVLEATPRRLAVELAQWEPHCLLFWLEERANITQLARLMGWVRERGARPLRIAIAYRLDGDVEAVLREAGAHGVLPIDGRSVRGVPDAVRTLVNGLARRPAARDTTNPIPVGERSAALKLPIELVRPP